MSEQQNKPIIESINCPACTKESHLKVLKVDIPGEVPTLISSIQCPHCNYRDNAIHDGDTGNGIGVSIDCIFKNPRDICRLVRLAENSQIKIQHNRHIFEFKCISTGIYLVESIITDIIESYKTNETDKRMAHEYVGLSEQDRNKRIRILKDLIENPDFLMTIRDDTGTSRVAMVDTMFKDIDGTEMELFDDESVKHSPYKVKDE